MREKLRSFVKRSPVVYSVLYPLSQAGISWAELCRRQWWVRVRARHVSAYLASHTIRKLQIGTGPNPLADWLNTDIRPSGRSVIFLDAGRPLPFESSTFDYIFCEHLIEHLSYEEGCALLREAFRVLNRGGKIRLATPDLERVIGLSGPDRNKGQQAYIRSVIDRFIPEAGSYRASFTINALFHYWGHKFLYDASTLESVLKSAGFAEVVPFAVGESSDEHLEGLESHGKVNGSEESNQFITMVLEATRP